MKKILVIQSKGIPPANTGQGTSIIQYALIQSLLSEKYDTGYLLISGTNRFPKNQQFVHQALAEELGRGLRFWEFSSTNFKEDQKHLKEVVEEFQPDICIVYQFEGIKLVRLTCSSAYIVAVSVDLEFLPKLMHLLVHLRYDTPADKLRWLSRAPALLKEAFKKWRNTYKYYPLANAHINHASHHAAWIAKKFHKPVLYTPNPVTDIEIPPPPKAMQKLAQPARFLLLGGLQGIATLSGLYFFADKVLPLLRKDILEKKLEIRLIGRDKLVGRLATQLRDAGVIECGFVADLADEMEKATAMLVPTEITLGFRTRILDAFRYRLAVIAHRSNQAGFPELQHDHNCLISDGAQDFASQMKYLAENPEEAVKIGEQAYSDFCSSFSSKKLTRRIINWLNQLRYGDH